MAHRGVILNPASAQLNRYEREPGTETKGGTNMLWTIFVIVLILWLLGMVSSYTVGGFIHLLLLIALVVLIFQLLTGRRTVA